MTFEEWAKKKKEQNGKTERIDWDGASNRTAPKSQSTSKPSSFQEWSARKHGYTTAQDRAYAAMPRGGGSVQTERPNTTQTTPSNVQNVPNSATRAAELQKQIEEKQKQLDKYGKYTGEGDKADPIGSFFAKLSPTNWLPALKGEPTRFETAKTETKKLRDELYELSMELARAEGGSTEDILLKTLEAEGGKLERDIEYTDPSGWDRIFNRDRWKEESAQEAAAREKLLQNRQAQDQLKYSNYLNLMQSADFAQYSQPAGSKVESKNGAPRISLLSKGDFRYDYINDIDGFRKEADAFVGRHAENYHGSDLDMDKYAYMNPEEIGVYNYLYNKDGAEKANEFLATLDDILNYRHGLSKAKDANTDIEKILYAVPAGLEQFSKGVEQVFKDEALPTTATQYAASAIRQGNKDAGIEGMGAVGGFVYDSLQSMSNMAPSILLSSVATAMGAPAGAGAIISAGTMGVSAAGNAYNEKLKQGFDKGSASTYAMFVGASEATLQYAIGGLSKMGGKLSVSKVANNISAIDNAFGRVALKVGTAAFSEGFEEALQEILKPIISTLTLSEKYEAAEIEDIAYSFLLGAVSGGLLEGGTVIAEDVQTTRSGKTLTELPPDIVNDMIQQGLESDPNSTSYEVAMQLRQMLDKGQTLSPYQVGRLYGEMRDVKVRSKEETVFPEQTQPETPDPLEQAAMEAVQNEAATLEDVARQVTQRETAQSQETSEKVKLPEVEENPLKTAENANTETAPKNTTVDPEKADLSKLGENGKKLVETLANKTGRSAADVSAEVETAYEAGRADLPMSKVSFVTETQRAAFNAGRMDAIKNINAKPADGTGKIFNNGQGGFVRTKAAAGVDVMVIANLNRMGKALGAKISFAEQVKGGAANGHYRNGEIVIARDAEDPYMVVAKHEITHYMQEVAPKEYIQYRKAALAAVSGNLGMDIAHAVVHYQERAARHNVKLTSEKAMDEIAADFTEALLTDPGKLNKFLTDMSKTDADRSTVEKLFIAVRQFIDNVKKAFKGDKKAQDDAANETFGATVKQLERAEAAWKEMYKAARDNLSKAVENGNTEAYNESTTDEGDYSLKYWYPDLTQTEWRMASRGLDGEGINAEGRLDSETGWFYSKSKGSEVFVIYGEDDTMLFAVGGKDAALGKLRAADYYEEVKNGTLRDRKSYRKWIETLRAGLPENNVNSSKAAHRSAKMGNDKLSVRSGGQSPELRGDISDRGKDSGSYSLKKDDAITLAINQSMTMAQAKDMVQRAFVLGGIKEWFEGEYKNGDEWLRGEGVDSVAVVIDNEWALQEKFLNKIQGILDDDFTSEDILNAYLAGTLTGKQAVNTTKRIDTSIPVAADDGRFYAPKQIENAQKAYEIALQKVTNKNRDEVYKARAEIIIFAHTRGAAEALGLTQSELNKKLSQWARYNARAKEVSQRFNQGVAEWNKWTGIENSNILSRMSVSNEELDMLVGEITGDSDGYQRKYIMRTMLALDTHIDYSGLNFAFVGRPDSNRSSVNGLYLDSARKITVKYNAPHTVAHEMGHYLDYQWARDVGVGGALTDRLGRSKITDPEIKQWVENFDNFKEKLEDVSDTHSGYSMDSKEVFARFVDKFVQWVNYTANGETSRSYTYNDKFTAQHYIEFVRLLQEKSVIDGKKKAAEGAANKDFVDEGSVEEETGGVRYSLVKDKKILDFLNNQEHVKVYRAMQMVDGKLYPPMAALISDETGKKKRVEPTERDAWYQADENPRLIKFEVKVNGKKRNLTAEEMAANESVLFEDSTPDAVITLKDGSTVKYDELKPKFELNKGNGAMVPAAYNPYFHTSATPLNDQFSSAFDRPNLVVVEGFIPKSELTSEYKARYAKDAVGEAKWHAGPVAGKLRGDKARRVFLSRWFKVDRIVPEAEIAQTIAKILDGENIAVPWNVVTPSLRVALEEQGVDIDYKDVKMGSKVVSFDSTQAPEAQYSLKGKNKLGIEVYETSEETLKLSWKERKAQFLDVMANEYAGRTAKFVRNGHTYYATFEEADVRKNIYGDKRSDNKGWRAKINAGADGDIFELVENSKYNGSEPEKGKKNKAHNGVGYWDYFVKKVQIDGTVFDLIANVRKKATGEFVYSLQLNEDKNTKAAPPNIPSNKTRVFNRAQAAVDGTVAQNAENVNRANDETEGGSYSLKDSRGKALTKEQQEYFADSVVRDGKGNLLVVYHTSKNDFTVFDKARKGETTGDFNTYLGFFFAESPDYMKNFSAFEKGKTKAYYLNMKQPIDMTNISEQAFVDIVEVMGGDIDEATEFYAEAAEAADGEPLKLSELLEEMTGEYDYADFFEELQSDFDQLIDKGYDGVIHFMDEIAEEREFIVFEPEQAKLTSNESPTADEDVRFSLKGPSKGLVLRNEVTGSYGAETFMVTTAYKGDKIAGKLSYSVYEDTPSVKFIETANGFKRQGVARQLLQDLQKKYPDAEIDFGMLTEDGSKLIDAVTYEKRDEKVAAERNKLTALQGELDELQTKLDELYEIDEWSEEQQSEVERLGDRWQEVYEEVHSLESELYGTKATRRFVKTDGSFSLKGQSDILRENARLKEVNTALREQFKLTEFAKVDKKQLDKFAKTLLKDYESGADINEVRDALDELYTYIANGEGGVSPVWEDVYSRAVKVAETVLEGAVTLNDDLYQEYKSLRNYLRTTRIRMPDKAYDKDLSGYESINEFRKLNYGRINLVREGTPVDMIYQELAYKYPEFFDEDVHSNPSDQLVHIAEVLDSLQPYEENRYSGDMRNAAAWLADDIIERFYELPQAKPTFADKAQRKLTEQAIKDRKKLERVREEKNKRIAQLIERSRGKVKLTQEKERAKRAEAVEKVKEHYTAKEERASEKRKASIWRKKINKHVETITKMLVKGNDNSHVPEEMRGVVGEFLSVIDLSTPRQKEKTINRLNELRNLYKKIADNESDIFVEVDPDLMAHIDIVTSALKKGKETVSVTDLNNRELEALYRTLLAVERSIYMHNKTMAYEKTMEISELARNAMNELATDKAYQGYSNNIAQAAADMVNMDMLNPQDFFIQLGGTMSRLFRSIRIGFDTKIKNLSFAKKYMAELVGDTKLKTISGNKAVAQEFKTEGGEKISLTPAQVMSLYLLQRQPDALGHIYEGGIKPAPVVALDGKNRRPKVARAYDVVKVTPNDVAAILKSMTSDQKRIADGIGKFFTEHTAQWGNEVSMALYGYKKFTVENYFPIVSDKNYLKDVFGETTDATLKNMGSTKARIQGANNPIIIEDVMDVFARQTDTMSSYNAFVIPLSDIQRVFNFKTGNGSVKQSIEKRFGVRTTQYFKKLMTDINGGAKWEGGSVLLNEMISKYKQAKMGLNLRVLLQQPTAMIRAAAVIDGKYLAEAMVKEPRVDIKTIYKYAPVAEWRDWGFFSLDTGKQMKDVMLGTKKMQDYTMWAYGKADELAWKRIWVAAELEIRDKHKGLKVGSNEYYQAVGDRFSEIIDRTQVVDSVFHRAQLMRSPDSLVRMSVSFMNEPFKAYNMLRTATAQMKNSPTEATKRAFAAAAGAYLTSIVINHLITALVDTMRGEEDDEEWLEKVYKGIFLRDEKALEEYEAKKKTWVQRYLWHFADNLVNEPLSMFPFAKDVVSLIQGYDIKRMDMQGIGDFVNAIKSGLSDKYTAAEKVGIISAKFAELFGVPASNVKRELNTAVKTMVGAGGNLMVEYMTDKMVYRVSSNKARFMDILYKAYKQGDMEAYTKIAEDMIEEGIEPSYIESGLKSRAKKDGITITDIRGGVKPAEKKEERDEEEKFNSNILTAKEWVKYDERSGDLVEKAIDYFNRNGMGNMDEETAQKLVDAAYDYAEYTALFETAGAAVVYKGEQQYIQDGDKLYESNVPKWVLNAQDADELGLTPEEYMMLRFEYKSDIGADGVYKAHDAGVDVETYLEFRDGVSNLEYEKGEAGARKAAVIALLNSMGLSQDDYDYLFGTMYKPEEDEKDSGLFGGGFSGGFSWKW